MSEQVFHVTAQGVDPDLTRATGLYDPIDLGTVGIRRLEEILKSLSRLHLPEGLEHGEDLCVPQIIVTGSRGEFAVNLADDDGTLFCETLGGNLDATQALAGMAGERRKTPNHSSRAEPRPACCSNCGEPFQVGDAFCAGCGQPIPGTGKAGGEAAARAREPGQRAKAGSRPKPSVEPAEQDGGNDFDRLSREVIQLMANPVSLREYRSRYPFLLDGAKSKTWARLRQFMFSHNPSGPIHARLTSPPCDWALRKPEFFRRLLTLVVDVPALFILLVIEFQIGSMVCRSLGFAQNSTGEGILILSAYAFGFIGYFVISELILGASPGGFLLGLRVIDDHGKPPTAGFLIMRQVWKVLDIFFFFLGGAARSRLPPTSHVSIPIPELMPGNVVLY